MFFRKSKQGETAQYVFITHPSNMKTYGAVFYFALFLSCQPETGQGTNIDELAKYLQENLKGYSDFGAEVLAPKELPAEPMRHTVIFKERGNLGGASTTGMIFFQVRYKTIDTLFREANDGVALYKVLAKIKKNNKSSGNKDKTLSSLFTELGKKLDLQYAYLKTRWSDLKGFVQHPDASPWDTQLLGKTARDDKEYKTLDPYSKMLKGVTVPTNDKVKRSLVAPYLLGPLILTKSDLSGKIVKVANKVGLLEVPGRQDENGSVTQNSSKTETTTVSSSTSQAAPLVEKRAAPLLIVAGAVLGGLTTMGTGLGFYTANAVSAIDQARKEDKKMIVTAIGMVGDRVSKLEVTAHYLQVQNNITQLRQTAFSEDMKLTNQYYHVVEILENLDRQLDRFTDALEGLFHGQLSLYFVDKKTMEDTFVRLKRSAEKAHLTVPMADSMYLYQLRASYYIAADHLQIAIPVPLFATDNLLTVYEYLRTPLKLPDSKHYVAWDPQKQYLAVNVQRTGYVLLTEQQYKGCVSYGERFKSCEDTNFLLKDFSAHCLSALFDNKKVAVTKVCPVSIIAPRPLVEQIGEDEFLVYHPVPTSLETMCDSSTSSIPERKFEGTQIITLPKGCRARTSYYTLYAPKAIHLNITVRKAEQVYYMADFFTEYMSYGAFDAVFPEPPNFDQPLNDVLNRLLMHESNTSFGKLSWLLPTTFTMSTFALGSVACAIVTSVLCYCCTTRNRRKRAQRLVQTVYQQTRPREELEPLQQQQALVLPEPPTVQKLPIPSPSPSSQHVNANPILYRPVSFLSAKEPFDSSALTQALQRGAELDERLRKELGEVPSGVETDQGGGINQATMSQGLVDPKWKVRNLIPERFASNSPQTDV